MLTPDHLGQIYSGSMVIDHDDTAGFGAGSLVAIYTHHLRDGVQRQSLAVSTDGETWVPYAGNPVLESDAPDFRDPKVLRWDGPTGSWWVMALAVGQRIDLYRSGDLRAWSFQSSYSTPLPGAGVWECPDLVRLTEDEHDPAAGWLLVFGISEGGPGNHSATLGVRGRFDGRTFDPESAPALLDAGPDFYALQTFHGAAGPPVGMAWMSSWRYASAWPVGSWAGRMTLPRRLDDDGDGGVLSRPAPDLSHTGTILAGTRFAGRTGRAFVIEAQGALELSVIDDEAGDGCGEPVRADVVVTDRHVELTRTGTAIAHYAETYTAPVTRPGPALVVVDHGGVEVFAAGGSATISALVATGERWHVELDGDAVVREL